MPDVARLMEYWREHPPVHIMVAAWLGVKPDRVARASPISVPLELTALLGRPQRPTKEVSDLVKWAEGMRGRMGRA
jgi:hypothetical protein